MDAFINCYNAFVAGELVPPVSIGELDQIHPDDVEEMDISWQIAMAVFRAKKFTQTKSMNNWGVNVDKMVGLNKIKLRCYTSHEPGHFALEYTKPRVEGNAGRVLVPTGNNIDAAQNDELFALDERRVAFIARNLLNLLLMA